MIARLGAKHAVLAVVALVRRSISGVSMMLRPFRAPLCLPDSWLGYCCLKQFGKQLRGIL